MFATSAKSSRAARAASLLIAIVALGLAMLSAPASAASTGAVKGVITSETTHAKLAGMKVELLRAGPVDPDFEAPTIAALYKPYKSTTSDSQGRYSFTGLTVKPGDINYAIRVTDPGGSHRTTRAYIDVKSGKTLVKNVALKDAAIVTGRITRADGEPPSTIEASINLLSDVGDPAPEFAGTVKVRAGGSYRFNGLWANGLDYEVRFHDTTGKYADQCYDNKAATGLYSCEGSGYTPVSPVVGGLNPLNNQTLSHLGARFSGTVKDSSGHPIKGIVVRAPTSTEMAGVPSSTTFTQGTFAVRGLIADSYRLFVSDPAAKWASQWYDNKSSAASAQIFNVAEGESVTGLNVVLKSHAKMTVTSVRGSASAKVSVAITRTVTGLPAYGSVTVKSGSKTKTVALVGGKATVALTGLTSANTTFFVEYAGSASTEAVTKSYHF